MSKRPFNLPFTQDSCSVTSFFARGIVPWLVSASLIITVVACSSSAIEPRTTTVTQQSYTPQSSLDKNMTSGPLTITPDVSIDKTPLPSVSINATPHVDQESERFSIHLQWGIIDTRQGEPQLPDPLRIDAYAPNEAGYYIVQFDDVILPEWRTALESAGAEIMGYLPNNAFLVRISGAESVKLSGVGHVQWVGIYQPAYRIAPRLTNSPNEQIRLTIMTFPNLGLEKFASQLEDWGGEVIASYEDELAGTVKVEIGSTYIEQIARYNGVMWIEPWTEPELSP